MSTVRHNDLRIRRIGELGDSRRSGLTRCGGRDHSQILALSFDVTYNQIISQSKGSDCEQGHEAVAITQASTAV